MTQEKIHAQQVLQAGNYMFKQLLKEIDAMAEPIKLLASVSTNYGYNKRLEITEKGIETLTDMVTAAATLELPVTKYLNALEDLRKHKIYLTNLSKNHGNSSKN